MSYSVRVGLSMDRGTSKLLCDLTRSNSSIMLDTEHETIASSKTEKEEKLDRQIKSS